MDDDDDFDELDREWFDKSDYLYEIFYSKLRSKAVADILQKRRAWIEILEVKPGQGANLFLTKGVKGIVDGPYV